MVGAAFVGPRLCKEDGCGLPVRARGMCSKHYQAWAKRNPDLRVHLQTRKAILDAMPGTQSQIIAETGYNIQAVRKHLREMKESELAHIKNFDPPDVTGYKFEAVWHAGPGRNARLTDAIKIEYRCKRQRRGRLRRELAKVGWLGALGRIEVVP